MTTLRGNQLPAALKWGCFVDKYLNTRESDIEHRRYTIKLEIVHNDNRWFLKQQRQQLNPTTGAQNNTLGAHMDYFVTKIR